VKPVSVLRVLDLLGIKGPSFARWRASIVCAMGLPRTQEQIDLVRPLVGDRRLDVPQFFRVVCWAVGRRGGKSLVISCLAIYKALFCDWKLRVGEIGVVLITSPTKTQSGVVLSYIKGMLKADPALWAEVESMTADSITFTNGIKVLVAAADDATIRGFTVVGWISEEHASLFQEQATELMRAVLPAMATQPLAQVFVISSVYSATGPLAELRRKSFGIDDPHCLYMTGTTRDFNPTITQEFIDAELARDPVGNLAEYLSVERSDVAAYVDASVVDACTRTSPRELPPTAHYQGGPVHKIAAVDPSAGQSDATSAAIVVNEDGLVRVVAARRYPAPHDPKAVAVQIKDFLAYYGLTHAVADQYGSAITKALYREVGLTLTDAKWTRSEAYLGLLPLLMTGRIELPPDGTLRTELLGLERRTARSGKDSVDHRPGAHDDLANSVALAAVTASAHGAPAGEATVIRSDFADQLIEAGDYSMVAPKGFFDGYAG
jgi:hypothetical protein